MIKLILSHKLVFFLMFLVVLTVSSTIYFYTLNESLKREYECFILSSKTDIQNKQAFIDSLKQKPDSLQNYKVFVRNLKNVEVKNKDLINFLNKNIVLLKNNISILKDDTMIKKIIVFKDFDSSFVKVPFKGSLKGVHVSGETNYEVKSKVKSFCLNISKDAYNIQSYLYFNPTDSTISNAVSVDGEKVLSNTILDADLHKLILTGLPRKKSFLDQFEGGVNLIYNKSVNLDLGAFISYSFFDNCNISASRSFTNWEIKAGYSKTLHDWLK